MSLVKVETLTRLWLGAKNNYENSFPNSYRTTT
ncbi:hypothetical protein J3D55_003466 [Chryseobacterium ginsenosidimutans]|nr:hypothetical protein [Chryseobacterium ginsenosidimutans]